MKRPKIHFPDKSKFGHSVCGRTSKGDREWLSEDATKVTCKDCQKLIGSKTTEQGGPKKGDTNQLWSVVLLKNGANRISVIKVIREETGLGLKESKDLSDIPQYSGKEVKVMYDVARETAERFCQALTGAGADVRLDNQTGGSEFYYPGDTFRQGPPPSQDIHTTDLAQAYREMLGLFLPDDAHVRMLDELDDDQHTGHRPWPIVGKTPSIADVRRWLAAGGGKVS